MPEVTSVDGGGDACNGNSATLIGFTDSACQERYTSILLGPFAASWNDHAKGWSATCAQADSGS